MNTFITIGDQIKHHVNDCFKRFRRNFQIILTKIFNKKLSDLWASNVKKKEFRDYLYLKIFNAESGCNKCICIVYISRKYQASVKIIK